MNIAFAGTTSFNVPILEGLKKNFNLKLIITQPPRGAGRGKKIRQPAVKMWADKNNIQTVQPRTINDDETIKLLKEIKPDFLIVCAYGKILGKEVLDIPGYFPLNIHASILPELRGPAPINFALINGFKKTGISIIIMDEGCDTGDIVLEKEIDINEDDNFSSLEKKLSSLAAECIIQAVKRIKEENYKRDEQRHLKGSKTTFLTNAFCKIDFNASAFEVHNKIRGLSYKPGAWAFYKEGVYKFYRSAKADIKAEGQPGKIKVINGKLYAACADFLIEIKEIQRPGKKIIPASDFLKGFDFEENDEFN